MGVPEILPAFAVTVLILASITTASQNASCYFPDGSKATYGDTSYLPCKDISAGGVTYCCASTDVCTVRGYCLGGAGVFYRGGCTDQTWTSSLCPSLCAKVITDGFANFYPCNPGQFSYDNWVCGEHSGNNCDTPSFYFDPGAPFVPPNEAATATSTVTIAKSGTTLPSPTAAASALPNSDSCPTHNGAVLGVGVGVGVGLGFSAIAALSCFVVERRKRKSAEKEATEARASGFYQSDPKGYSNSKMAHEAGSQPLHEIGHSHRLP